ncbi:cardiac phospholamban-like [Scleropages formosus]|uniref:Phospholamban n=1 Tax=Scleropages formosus TaxID=113540 RepID=A0A0P7ZFK4_SCLFO|nr:cardiac phospholamban-like [Scleropages formosus]
MQVLLLAMDRMQHLTRAAVRRASNIEVNPQTKHNLQGLFINFILILICLLFIYILRSAGTLMSVNTCGSEGFNFKEALHERRGSAVHVEHQVTRSRSGRCSDPPGLHFGAGTSLEGLRRNSVGSWEPSTHR